MSSLPPLEKICETSTSSFSCYGQCVNGSCVNCPAGFGDETSLFHVNNCSQPLVLINVMCSIFIAIIILFELSLVPRLLHSRGQVRIVLASVQCSQAFLLFGNIAEISQTYASPVYYVFISLGASSCAVALTLTIITYARIVYKVASTRFPEMAFRILFVWSVLLLSSPFLFSLIPGSAFGDTDAEKANTMTAVAIALIPMQLLITGPMLVYMSSRLIETIHATRDNVRSAVQSVDRSSAVGATAVSASQTAPTSHVMHGSKSSHDSAPNEGTDARVANLMYRLRLFRLAMIWLIIPVCFFACKMPTQTNTTTVILVSLGGSCILRRNSALGSILSSSCFSLLLTFHIAGLLLFGVAHSVSMGRCWFSFSPPQHASCFIDRVSANPRSWIYA